MCSKQMFALAKLYNNGINYFFCRITKNPFYTTRYFFMYALSIPLGSCTLNPEGVSR